MSVIIVLLIASISVAGLFLAGFIWSIRDRQYDDEYSPPRRILFDDSPANRSQQKDFSHKPEIEPNAS